MRVFLDACIDPRAASLWPSHEVVTAFDAGWQSLPDGKLLSLVDERFDVLVTIDRGFEYQHNLREVRIGIVIVHVARNKVDHYRAIVEEIEMAIQRVRPGQVVHVASAPRLTPMDLDP